MAIKTIRVFAEYTSDGYVPMPSQGNIDYGVTVGSTFPETQPSSFQTDDPNIDVAVTTMTDFYVWIRTHGSAWNPNYTRVVRVYPDSPSINSVVMNMIVAVGGGGTTISSGGGVNYYLNGGTYQGILDGSTYYEMNKVPVEGTGVDFFKINTTGFQNIAQFVTDAGDPGLLNIPAGNWPLGFYMSASDNSGAPKFYAEIYKYSAAGVFTLLGSSVATPEVISNGQAIDYYTSTVAIPDTTLLVTDRIAIRIFVNTDGNRTINLHTQDSHLSTVGTTFTRGLTAINGLIKQVQFLAIGNAGSDAAIVSSDDTHTINLPTASATKRGLLNSTDWSTFNAKQPALSGDGFVKISGSTISYDNSSYQPLDGDLTAIGALAGTSGILKKTGANTWELDTSVYLSTASAASTYQRLDKMVSNLLPSDTEYPNSNAVLAKLALKADAANPSFTGSMNISGAESRVNFYDENAARKYFIGYDGGFLRIYQDAGSTSRFYINSSGKTFIPGTLEVGTIIKTSGLATEFLKADGTIDSNTYALNSALANYLLSATAGTTYQTLANLSTDLTASTTKYPSVTAVNNGLATKQPLDADLTAIAALTGTSGLLKKTAADTWTLDTAAYITSSALTNYLLSADAATTYQRKDKMVSNLLASDTEYPNSNAVIAALALKANAANPTFTGDFTISGTTPRLYFVDTDNNPDYTLFTDSGYFYIYNQTAGSTKLSINPSGDTIIGGGLAGNTFSFSTGSRYFKSYSYGTDLIVNTSGGWAQSHRIYNEASPTQTWFFGAIGTTAFIKFGDPATIDVTGYNGVGFGLSSTGAATFDSSVTSTSFIKTGGTSSQFLMANGSVSTNPGWITSYTETDTLATVTSRGATTSTAVTFNGNVTSNGTFLNVAGYMDLTGQLYLRGNVSYLNVAGNAWNSFLVRNGERFDGYFANTYNTGSIVASGYIRVAGAPSNTVYWTSGTSSADFGAMIGMGTSSRTAMFRGNGSSTSVWWGGPDGNGTTIPYTAIDATSGEFTFWRNSGGTGGGAWTNIMTMNSSGLTMVNGSFNGNVIGNASGSAGSTNYLSALGDYVFNALTNGRDFNRGIQTSFVSGNQSYPNYGSVVRIRTYTGTEDGGTAELYFPYSVTYGGGSMQYRMGQYPNAGWSSWKTVIDSGNIGSQTVAQAGNINGKITTDGWLRTVGDSTQLKFYGNSRTMVYRTDGNTNEHGGGGYAHIFYYGGSADTDRKFIINTDGRLYSPYHGWLDQMSISGSAGSLSNTNISQFTNNLGYLTSLYGWQNTPDSWYGIGQTTSASGATAVGGNLPWALSWHSGLALSAHSVYGGIRFYNQNYPTGPLASTPAMTIVDYIVYASNSFRAPIFYDSQNTAYYLDPDSQSYLNYLQMPHRGNGTPNIRVNDGGEENWRGIQIGSGGNYGIGISGTSRSWSGRESMAFHVGADRSFRVHSDGWDSLFEVNGSTGVSQVKGRFTARAGVGGASGNNTVVGLRISGYNDYDSLEFGIEDNYNGVIRSYGNNIKYYAGHWKNNGATASEDHQHEWYTSQNGSSNWSSAKMILQSDGILNTPKGYISNGNPWGTSNSAYFPNGITTAGGTNWIYGSNTYIGNAPSNGQGHQFWSSGSAYSTGVYEFGQNYGGNNGIGIRYGNEVGGYGRIRFYNSDAQHSTIHSFSNTWQNGNVTISTGCINIDGYYGVTLGAWNIPDFYISKGGSGWFRYNVTAAAFYESSDSRLKDLLEDDVQVKNIENLKAKLYIKGGKEEYGYFAQEAETYMPSAVTKNEDGYLNLSYREVHTVKIARLEQRVAELEKQLKLA